MATKNLLNEIEPGLIVFNNLGLDFTRAIDHQIDRLKEDLLQIEFPREILLDLGWYPSVDLEGGFQLRIVKSHNWDEPLYIDDFSNPADLEPKVLSAVELCKIQQLGSIRK